MWGPRVLGLASNPRQSFRKFNKAYSESHLVLLLILRSGGEVIDLWISFNVQGHSPKMQRISISFETRVRNLLYVVSYLG